MQSTVGGFEKSDLALRQLRRAVQLFNDGDFVCATTLAGAAEEVLGRIAEKRAGTSALEDRRHFWSRMADFFGKARPNRKKVIESHNRLRNQLKHNNNGDNDWVTADFEFEAQDLIDRAIRNFWLAYDKPPNDRTINNYINRHWL